MPKPLLIAATDCDVYLASPVEYEACIVLVEHQIGLLFTVTDEARNGKCAVDIPASTQDHVAWSMSVSDLRAILDRAERLLVVNK